jgi:predicted nucleic acid-binding protein
LIVVDASAAVTMFLNLGPSAARVRERLGQAAEEVHIPHLFDVEVLHALRRHSLRGHLSGEQSRLILSLLHEMRAVRYQHAPLAGRIWELRENLTAYDAAYVALAEVLDAPLLTTDRRLAQAPGVRATVELYG